MIINFQENIEENTMLNEIKNILGETIICDIYKEIDNSCKSCLVGKAISLVSEYGSDWSATKMQEVYNACKYDVQKSALYAGIIFKDAVRKSKNGNFEIKKRHDGLNLYYKR